MRCTGTRYEDGKSVPVGHGAGAGHDVGGVAVSEHGGEVVVAADVRVHAVLLQERQQVAVPRNVHVRDGERGGVGGTAGRQRPQWRLCFKKFTSSSR